MFAIQFLNTGEVWLMVKPEDIKPIGQYLSDGTIPDTYDLGIDLNDTQESIVNQSKMIRSSSSARESFHKQQKSKYNKIRSAR